jgi:ribosome-binding factor A
MAAVKRATRVAGRMQEELSGALRELEDPRLRGVLVSRVELTDDLQSARVYVRRELGGADARAVKTTLDGLRAASSRLRKVAGQGLGLRYMPELRFFYDDSLDAVTRIEELLEEVKRDGGPRGEG